MLLTELQSQGGEEICELICTYTYITGSIQEPTQETITVKYGSLAGGSLSTPLYLQYGQEFVTELSGMSGDYVTPVDDHTQRGFAVDLAAKPRQNDAFWPLVCAVRVCPGRFSGAEPRPLESARADRLQLLSGDLGSFSELARGDPLGT